MAKIRTIENHGNGYTAPPDWWAGLPDTLTLSIDDIERIISAMGWEHIDTQSFLELASKPAN